jgi:hypothetical protein
MMRYRLRTLLIVLALGPPVAAAAWYWQQKPVERNYEVIGRVSDAYLIEIESLIAAETTKPIFVCTARE